MSFNQMTADQLSLAEAAALCADAGIRWFGPWRHKVAEVGAAEARRILDGHGLRVSSLCRGGFFLAAGEAEDNRRAVDEAAALGTDVLVLAIAGHSVQALATTLAHFDAVVPVVRRGRTRMRRLQALVDALAARGVTTGGVVVSA